MNVIDGEHRRSRFCESPDPGNKGAVESAAECFRLHHVHHLRRKTKKTGEEGNGCRNTALLDRGDQARRRQLGRVLAADAGEPAQEL